MPAISVIDPGLFTTVQDAGRPGFASIGVPCGGAADALSLRAANRALGNDERAAALELTLTGGTFEPDGPCTILIAGIRASATITSPAGARRAAAAWTPLDLQRGDRLSIDPIVHGCRGYLCVRGGIDVPIVMGSRATLPAAGFGGHEGRALRAGDRLQIHATGGEPRVPSPEAVRWVEEQVSPSSLRVIRQPSRQVPDDVITRALRAAWRISEQSDRAGVRLTGEPVSCAHGGRMPSEGMPHGAIQLPESGLPIVLGVDHPTTGGYPVIACVISADLPALGQARPRGPMRFDVISLDEARAAARGQRAEFERLFPRAAARSIDLNCDLGEDPAAHARDVGLLEIVTSCNIACGGHAGDDESMRAMIRAASRAGVAIGAHPGYADRANFGRVVVEMSISDLRHEISDQVFRLAGACREEGAVLRHIKPHGALYHAAMMRADVALAVAEAAKEVDQSLILIGLAGAPALDWWRSAGFRVIAEAFADRRYEPNGSLRSRSNAHALITDPAEAAAQALSIARDGVVAATGVADVPISADTICVHSDTPCSMAIARAVRRALESAGVSVRPPR